ncbi:MAG: secretin N-terminal domain-containing protein [Candidatus Omnitrophota bacterium]
MKYSQLIFMGLICTLVLLSPHQSFAGVLSESRFIYPEYSKTISMDFENADLNDVLKIFSQQSGLNFIAADEVIKKKITLYLDKVPVDQALERILQANNLTYEIKPESNIFVVKPIKEPDIQVITRVYKLKYATVLSSKLNNTFAIIEDADSGSSSDSSSKSEDSGLVPALKGVLSELGKIIEDPRTNSIIVTDLPSQFPMIERTIARLDVPIPQILIEVEMLDISQATADLLGVKFGETPLVLTGAERDHYYPWNNNKIADKIGFTADEYRVGTIDASGLSATLQLLKTNTDTKSLARPRILTLNNETAQIRISTNEAIGIKSVTQSAEGSSVLSVEAERVQTGIFLTVTPQANLQTSEITMAIAPRVIEAKTGGTFSGQTFKDPENRGSKSILRIRDGETIILGGLLRKEFENIKTKVPFISDIPIIGAAFRHKNAGDTNRELVIFITPHIVSEERSPRLAMRDTGPMLREQDIPSKKLQEIEAALGSLEK